MGKTKAAVKKVPAVKSDVKPEAKKDTKETVKATVRLKEAFMSLNKGVYEVEAYTGDGNPILKTDKGPVTVALDLVDVVPVKGKKVAPAPVVKGQMEIPQDKKPYYIDSNGQMTIKNIDAPWGLQAQECIKAEKAIEVAQQNFNKLMSKMMADMKKDKLNKIKVLGRVFVYMPPKQSEEKLVIKDAFSS